jgi:DNA-binding CsgD family transcriptional regulator
LKPVWLYHEYLRGLSLKDQALQDLPHWFELTLREQDVIRYVINGHSPKEIAQALGCSPEHVYNMRARIRSKLGIRETVSLRNWVLKNSQVAKSLLLCLITFGLMNPCVATSEAANFKEQTTWLANLEWPDQAAALDSSMMHWIPTLNATQMRLPGIRIWTLACLLTDQEEGLRKMAPVVLRMTELDSAWVAEELQGLRWAYDPWYEQWTALWRMQALELENTSGQIQSQITPRHILKAAAPDLYRHDRLNAHAMASAWHDILELEAWAQQNWQRDQLRWHLTIGVALLVLCVFAMTVAHLLRKHRALRTTANAPLPISIQARDREIRRGLKTLEEMGELGWVARVDLAQNLQNLALQNENHPDLEPDLELTKTEMRFAILLLLGRTTEDIASELNCSKSRIYNIRAKLRAKLDIGNTTSLSKTLRDRWALGRMLLEVADE